MSLSTNFKGRSQEFYQAALKIRAKYGENQNWGKEDAARFESFINGAMREKQLAEFTAPKFNALPIAQGGRASQNAEALKRYFETGDLSGLSTRIHSESDPALGGAVLYPDFQTEVIAAVAAGSEIRKRVSARTTKSNPYVAPKFTEPSNEQYGSTFVGSWKPEGMGLGDSGTAPTVQQNPTTGQLSIYLKNWYPDIVVITRELLQDSAVNLEQELISIFASTLINDLESAYLNGDGLTQPRGIMTHMDTGITSVTIGTGTNITYTGLVDLYSALPSQYLPNAVFVMNRQTYAKLLKLAGSTNDHPLIAAGFLQQSLWGKPIILSDFIANVATGVGSILFGDLSQYRAVDRMDMEVLRLTDRFAPNVGLLPYGRFGGQVAVFQGFRIGKTS